MKIKLYINSINELLTDCCDTVLNQIQITIIEGSLVGKSYQEIADRSTYSVEYIREVGAKDDPALVVLLAEASEIMAMQTASIKTTKKSLGTGS